MVSEVVGNPNGLWTTKMSVKTAEKFAELIVEECRTVVNDLYRKTPLELCGPLLTADEEIAKHFYGVEE
jgi:(2Fe-2S) ferredoxin